MIWDLLNTGLRIACMVLTIMAITQYRGYFNRTERMGLSFASGTAFMTIDVIWYQKDSFLYWSGSAFTLGVCVFLWGLLKRKRLHDRANEQLIERAKAWQKGKNA